MIRLFSIDVNFNNQKLPALVSIREKGNDICCQVRYIDKRAHHILPGDILIFNLAEGMKQPQNINSDLAEELVRQTAEAISKQLHD